MSLCFLSGGRNIQDLLSQRDYFWVFPLWGSPKSYQRACLRWQRWTWEHQLPQRAPAKARGRPDGAAPEAQHLDRPGEDPQEGLPAGAARDKWLEPACSRVCLCGIQNTGPSIPFFQDMDKILDALGIFSSFLPFQDVRELRKKWKGRERGGRQE